jgi:hypothetical protein
VLIALGHVYCVKKMQIGWSYATIVLGMEAIEGRLLRTSVVTWNFGL